MNHVHVHANQFSVFDNENYDNCEYFRIVL